MILRLAAVLAHPDDDAFTLGGTLLRHAGRIEATIVLCTSGGNGPIWEPVATRRTLAEVREREHAAWCRAIGLSDARVVFLRHPDWHLPEVPLEELVGSIEAILRDRQPQVVVTFGSEGMTHHHDHIRTGEATTEVFHRARSSPGALQTAFGRLYQVALRRSAMVEFYGAVGDRGLPFGQQDDFLNPVGGPDERIAVDVDVTDVYEKKLEAIRTHRSQIGELERIPRDLQPLHLAHECFVQAWPSRDPGPPVADDLFEALERA